MNHVTTLIVTTWFITYLLMNKYCAFVQLVFFFPIVYQNDEFLGYSNIQMLINERSPEETKSI